MNHHVKTHSDDKRTETVQLEITDRNGAIITFDHPNKSANIFDRDTLLNLEEIIDSKEVKKAKGVLFISAKPSIFIAGADLNTLAKARGDELRKLIEHGQMIFSKIAALEGVTIAAIHGACLGGGLELALACDRRIASSDKASKIGLPETLLGIIPAWGGSTRLPKLIGVPKALGLILAGKQLAPKHALKMGVIDAVVPRERLQEYALSLFDSTESKRKSHFLTNNPLSSAIIRAVSRRKLLAKTRGNYPALEEAVNVVTRAGSSSITVSLEREVESVVKLAGSDTTKNLMRIFHLQERAKKFRYDDSVDTNDLRDIENTAVIGAGVMGSGIAQWFAARDKNVILKDINLEAVANGMATILSLFSGATKKRIFTRHEAQQKMDRIFPTAEAVPMTECGLVVEAAVENLQVKKIIFLDLCSRTSPSTILATNTSALPITELCEADGITHPERIIGLHFFNPVSRMKLVEIIVTKYTSPDVVERALRFVRQIGKLPVVVQDSPGFVVNRILMPYLIEAGNLVDQGYSPKVIDKAMLDFGMPMGPIRLIDEVGLDVAAHVAGTMSGAFGDRFAVPAVLTKKVKEGSLGKKAGRGFYEYDEKGKSTLNFDSSKADLSEKEIADRLVSLMVKESKMCLEEGVAASADDIDFAMILGTGFAPFRGGPLTHSTTKEATVCNAKAEAEPV